MRIKKDQEKRSKKDSNKYFINCLDGVDLFRANNILIDNIRNIDKLNNLNKFTILLFFFVSHRLSKNIDRHKKFILESLGSIQLRDLPSEVKECLSESRQSLLLTYTEKAIRSLEDINLDSKEYNQFYDFFEKILLYVFEEF